MRMFQTLCSIVVAGVVVAGAQAPEPPRPAPVEKLGPTTYRIGKMRVDTAKREVVVPGTVNPVTVLEFVANTPQGIKAYESAFTLESSAISFNAAMLLIGLDPSRAKPSMIQFDPTPPEGDPVEIEVELQIDGSSRRLPIHEFLYDERTKSTIAGGPWVYTGSTFVDYGDPSGRRYLAESDGILIGMMHGPQAIIDNPRADAVGGYGSIVLNPKLKIAENAPIAITIRALGSDRKQEH